MAKASTLTIDVMNAPQATPQGALPPRGFVEAAEKKTAAPVEKKDALVQIRCLRSDAKAIKQAALDADMTISDFMLVCFHAYMKR
jgi:predicted DNA binding CopG/RHH family protein